jgi:hypothetical protein
MAREYIVHYAVSGGIEEHGPYQNEDTAVAVGCALLKTHGPAAVVSIVDDKNDTFQDGASLEERCRHLGR